MRIVVSHDRLAEVVEYLCSLNGSVIALDTETYGLKWDDKLFALQLAVSGDNSYYFNFHDYKEDFIKSPVLDRSVFKQLSKLWNNSNHVWVMANAKFDMRRLDIEGVQLNGQIYDVLLMDRIKYNRNLSYSLDACLKRIGLAKNDEVSKWITENKAYTNHHVDGKKTKEKDLHYDRVPFDIMVEYGFDDVEDTLKLYEHQFEYFAYDKSAPNQSNLVASNIELTKTVFAMEKLGIQLDIPYCKEMLESENKAAMDSAKIIEELSNKKFTPGPKWLTEVFNEQGIVLETSSKGNPILDKGTLSSLPNAIAHHILEMRDHEKRASTFSNLLRFADSNGVLHTNYRLNGTDTLRFSSSDPNLQNIEACGKDELRTVRTAFIPRPEHFFVSIDYKTMEYRLCADIAGEMDWIDAINNGGDPHQWVADLMGVERKAAKTLNFMLLYGGGLAKLATSLYDVKSNDITLKAICKIHVYNQLSKATPREIHLASSCPHDILEHDLELLRKADKLKKLYFNSLPAVAQFTKKVQDVVKSRGYVHNQYGARYFIDDPQFAYAIPNHLIQGTGACIIRSAMNKIAYSLEGLKSNMVLQIHDELLFEIHNNESSIIPELKRIMESEYKPYNGMELKCDVEYSTQNWNANTFQAWR